jgi:hypothetical protein
VTRIAEDKSVLLKLYALPFSFLVTHNSIRPDGSMLSVPSESVIIPTPTVGDIVTFSFDTTSRRDLPFNPKIFRIRTDISWDDILRSYFKEKQYLSGMKNS